MPLRQSSSTGFDTGNPAAVWIPLPESLALPVAEVPCHGANRVGGSLWGRLSRSWLHRRRKGA